jgi:hypothetical protein
MIVGTKIAIWKFGRDSFPIKKAPDGAQNINSLLVVLVGFFRTERLSDSGMKRQQAWKAFGFKLHAL